MATNLELTFSVEGRVDGPLSGKMIEAGITPEHLAHLFARDLKKLIDDEMPSDGKHHSTTTVHATARLHDVDERTGHAEATDES